MHTRFALAIGICALALGWSAAANAEYFNRYTSGSWINTQYNDGSCTYYYSFNTQTGEQHVNRYGNCSRVAIGPDVSPIPLVPNAQLIPQY